jgi:hypothetical protein
MVKKMTQNRDIRIQVRITQEEAEKIHEMAQKLKLTDATMIRNLLNVGMETADFMRKFGIIDLVGFFKENQIKPIEVLQLAETD